MSPTEVGRHNYVTPCYQNINMEIESLLFFKHLIDMFTTLLTQSINMIKANILSMHVT